LYSHDIQFIALGRLIGDESKAVFDAANGVFLRDELQLSDDHMVSPPSPCHASLLYIMEFHILDVSSRILHQLQSTVDTMAFLHVFCVAW
jgi:hypothetical protein